MMKTVLALLIFGAQLYGAIGPTAVWRLRPAGNDLNGGGFVTGGAGAVDYSQTDSPIAGNSGTDLVSANGNVGSCAVTSVAHGPFVAADVGNIINVSAGTNWTVKRAQILSVSGGAATMDSACSGTTAGITGGTWVEGGGLLSPGIASASAFNPGMTICVLAGTYTITSASGNVAAGVVNSGSDILWIGYSGTCTYGNTDTQPVFQGAVNTATLFTSGSSRAIIYNIKFDGGAPTFTAVQLTATGGIYDRCTFSHFDTATAGTPIFVHSVSTLNSATVLVSNVYWCEAFTNTATGINAYIVTNSISYNNSGATSDGINASASLGAFFGNVAYNNGRHGFNLGTTLALTFANNIAESNGRCLGSVTPCAAAANGFLYTNRDHLGWNNATFNNLTAAYSTAVLSVHQGDITLSGSPFTAAATFDFTLNNTAGAGALLRSLAFPSAMFGSASANYLSVGAVQQLAAGGATSYAVVQ